MARQLPPIDLHAHINPKIRPADLERLGAVVFAATRSLDEYESVRTRHDQVTIWGVGCHPGVAKAQDDFSEDDFSSLLASTSFVSEIGLDGRSKVPFREQEQVFGAILKTLQYTSRIASIHSAGATGHILNSLERTPIKGAVLHWWRGNESETRRAVELGCWFSINASGIRYPGDIALIPPNRVLTETDHPSGNRSSSMPRQPGSVFEVERELAMIYGIEPAAVREQIWSNFLELVDQTNVEQRLPLAVRRMVTFARKK